MAKEIKFNEEARRSLERGVNALADAVFPRAESGKIWCCVIVTIVSRIFDTAPTVLSTAPT